MHQLGPSSSNNKRTASETLSQEFIKASQKRQKVAHVDLVRTLKQATANSEGIERPYSNRELRSSSASSIYSKQAIPDLLRPMGAKSVKSVSSIAGVFSTADSVSYLSSHEMMGLDYLNNDGERSAIYSWNTTLLVKKAADMFFSLSYFEDAFRLYISIWNDLGYYDTPSWFRSIILAACVRSAITAIDLCDALKLLENEQSRLDTRKSTYTENLELVKLQMMFAEIYQRRGDDTLARRHAVLASKVFPDRGTSLAGERQNTNIDSPTCSYMSRYFIFAGLDACHTDDNALRIKTPEDQNLIRKWFEWSAAQLNRAEEVPRFWVTLFEDSQNLKWSQSVAIYCFLWKRWIELEMKRVTGNKLPDQTDAMMGVSVAETLAAICFTITEKSASMDNRSSYISRYSIRKDWDLLERAAVAADTLLASSSETLSLNVFKNLASQRHLLGFRETENLGSGAARIIVHGFIQDMLDVDLAVPPSPIFRDQHPVLSPTQDTRVTRQSQLSDAPSSMLGPRLASSIRSSSQSLLRLLRERIEEEMKNHPIGDEQISSSRRHSKLSWLSSIGGYSLFGITSRQPLIVDDLSEAMSVVSITNSENQ